MDHVSAVALFYSTCNSARVVSIIMKRFVYSRIVSFKIAILKVLL